MAGENGGSHIPDPGRHRTLFYVANSFMLRGLRKRLLANGWTPFAQHKMRLAPRARDLGPLFDVSQFPRKARQRPRVTTPSAVSRGLPRPTIMLSKSTREPLAAGLYGDDSTSLSSKLAFEDSPLGQHRAFRQRAAGRRNAWRGPQNRRFSKKSARHRPASIRPSTWTASCADSRYRFSPAWIGRRFQ